MAIVETSKFQSPRREENSPKLWEIQAGLEKDLANLMSKLGLFNLNRKFLVNWKI
jgi:hypothetical protein